VLRSAVFPAYLTTFLNKPGYEQPIRIVDQILKSAGKFGFNQEYQEFFPNSSDSVDSAILKNALGCPKGAYSSISPVPVYFQI